jgi:hypothetical protein
MALTVEDGSGVAGANSYATAAEFVTFHTDRGNTALAEADTDQIEAALVKGTDYLEQKFRLLWKGSRSYSTQVLSWPRRGVDVPDFFDPFFRDLSNVPISFQDTLFVPENEVPYEVKVANFLIAAETFDANAESTGVLQETLGGRLTQKEKLGALEVVYFPQGGEGGEASQKITYWDVNQTVEPFLMLSRLFGGQLLRN